uniref:malate:quinone oxidoreductase n=1 Tax=Staphylococcus aureus TaxID=1280 RepID=UPI0016430101
VTPAQPLQVINDIDHSKPNLQFPTQLITSHHPTLPPLLPPSPRPSTPLHIIFHLLHPSYPHQFKPSQPNIKQILPSFPYPLTHHHHLYHKINQQLTNYLQLK